MTMIQLTSKLKGIALAVSVYMVCFGWLDKSYSQTYPTHTNSPCFSVYVVYDTLGTSCDDATVCGPNPNDTHTCDKCVIVTICTDSCTGVNPYEFTIVSRSNTDCHSVCSSGDFTYSATPSGSSCSWYNTRKIWYKNVNGVPDNTCASFRICRNTKGTNAPPAHQTYDITVTSPATPQCNGHVCDFSVTF